MASCRRSSLRARSWGALALALLGACRPDQGQPARIVARVHTAGQFVSMVALDPSSSALLGVADRDELRVWAVPTTGATPDFSVPSKGPLIVVDFAAPERVMAVTATGNFFEWNWATGAITLNHKLYSGGVAGYSSDGRYLAVGGELWDRKEQRDLATLRVHEQTALQFSADGSRLLTAGRHPFELTVREPHSGRIFQERFSQDIRTAAL